MVGESTSQSVRWNIGLAHAAGGTRLGVGWSSQRMQDDLRDQVAMELIVLDLERLARQAEENNLVYLSHLIARALIEARKQLGSSSPGTSRSRS